MSYDREINLTNFLPVAMDDTEMSSFVQVFQDYLNSSYLHPTSGSSVLNAIDGITELRNVYRVPQEYASILSSDLGSQSTPNYDNLFAYFKSLDTSASDDVIGENTTNVIRQYIDNLSRIYLIKTNTTSLFFLMGLFGIESKVYSLWTDDYVNNWIPVNLKNDLKVTTDNTPEIFTVDSTQRGYYSSPHFLILIDDTNEKLDQFPLVSGTINKLINQFKPVNTVFGGFGLLSSLCETSATNNTLSFVGEYTNGISIIDISGEYPVI